MGRIIEHKGLKSYRFPIVFISALLLIYLEKKSI